MADRVRYVMRKDETWDAYVRDLVADRGYGKERTYVGVVDQKRANEIRQKLRTAGRHQGVSVKVFYRECTNKRCPAGTDCRYHVSYTAYRGEDARRYKDRLSKHHSVTDTLRKQR
jgi:hypothetical protein